MRSRRSRRGMSLVELMMGVFVLGLTLVAAGALFPASAFLRDRSGSYSRAATIVQRKLEQIRKLPAQDIRYSNLLGAGIIDTTNVSQSGSPQTYTFTAVDQVARDLTGGTGTLQLTGVGSDLVRIDVTVSWQGIRGGRCQLAGTTFVANKEFWVEP